MSKATNYDELQSTLVNISDTLFKNRTVFGRALAPNSKQGGMRDRQVAAMDELLEMIGDFVQDVREAQEAWEGTDHDPFKRSSPNGATRSANAKAPAKKAPATKPAGQANKTRAAGSAPRSKGGAGKVAVPAAEATGETLVPA